MICSLYNIWAQRDSNPRPTAPQAAILSKLNYEPASDGDHLVGTKYELSPSNYPELPDVQYCVLIFTELQIVTKYLMQKY